MNEKGVGRPSLEKEIERISEENQLKRYGNFLEKHDAMLLTIENSLDDVSSVKYDIFNSPLLLGFEPQDDVTVQQLINSENNLLNKLLETFTSLCKEATDLENEARTKYYLELMIYGEGISDELEASNSDSLRVGKMLKVLQDLNCFVKRCQVVAVEFVNQLDCLYKTEQLQFITVTGAHFQDVFSHLADILVILVTFDEIMSNSALLEQWGMYRKTVKSVHHNYTTFQMDLEKLNALDNVLNIIESQLLSDKIFQHTLEQCCKLNISKTGKQQKTLSAKFLFYLKNSIVELEKLEVDTVDCLQAPEWVKLNALFVLYQYLFENVEKRLFKQLWEVNKKVSGVTLIGNVLWYPEQFLLRHCSSVKGFDMKLVQASSKVRQAYLASKAQNLLKDTHTYTLQISLWIIQMNAVFKEGVSRINLEHLKMRCSLLLKGVKFACRMSHIVKSMTNLHLSQGRPMTKSCLLAVCKIIELLKAVQDTFFSHFNKITDSIHCIIQHLSYQALNIISITKKSLAKDKSFLKKNTAALLSLNIAENALFGPGTPERLLLARLALSSCDMSQTFHDDHQTKLLKHLDHLNLICKLQENLTNICDCSFLYWHQVIIPIYFSNLFDYKTDTLRISYMLHALNDFSMPATNCIMNFTSATEESLKEKVLEPLCHHIETNLRLHIHSHLQLDSTNPFVVPLDDCRTLIHSKPLRLGDKYIDIKGYIEHYLNNMFYNLTTVVLHDWKTYGEMRRLALEKYALKTVEDHLPTQTLEQGLDILEIMRNIHVFVSKYLYNLNNQIFVEQWSNNKHLNTINIRHVANSIRTHGTGIMNTTVNFTYQFLRNKFYIFSQFMYDEQIKSRLLKDMRYFREHKTETDPCYSYDRADAFNKAIRKLGLSKSNQSYLDLFRLQISHIGNAMGYVRMIRSGGLHCCSNASVFLPSLNENLTFEELCASDELSAPTSEAARNLEHDVKNLAVNFAEGTEYFKLLVDVFAPVFRNPKNMHLKNFYIIVPPLTINFIEYLITSKDKMTKKDKSGAAFTDDGFAMGLAYILKLLNQNAELDSLHWFQSVRLKYNQQKQSLYQQRQLANKDDDKLQQTLALTEKRLVMFQQEFELLYYNFNSARIFFQ